MVISEYISDLLLFHEKVVLPGFGAFKIIRLPAQLQEGRVLPPRVDVVFDPLENEDDFLLISKIAEAEEIEMEEARLRVNRFIEEMKATLDKGDKFVMPGLGELSPGVGNQFLFKKEEGFKLDFETVGFESFELDPFAEGDKLQEEDTVGDSGTEKRLHEPAPSDKTGVKKERLPDMEPVAEGYFAEERKSSRGFIWVLSGSIVVILISFAIIALTTDLFDNLDMNMFKPGGGIETAEPPQVIIGSEHEFEPDLEAALDSLLKLEHALRPEFQTRADETIFESVYSEFHIIAGSFSVYKNAEELQRELNFQGYPSTIINRGDGFFRVSAASFSDKGYALSELEKFREGTIFKSAWVLGIN